MLTKLVTAALVLTSAISASTLLRVACGSTTVVSDTAGKFWSSDFGFSGGTVWSQPSAPTEPYKHLRYAPTFGYNFQLSASATYNVTLKFLEPNKTAAAQRIFSVSANGKPALISLDLFLLANGPNHSYDKSFPVTVGADGRLNLQFSAAVGNAVVSAIQIDDTLVPAGALKCLLGTVNTNQLPIGAKNVEIPIATVVSGDWRFEHVMVSEYAKFDSPGITVSMGRPGSNNSELTGVLVELGKSDGDVNFWYVLPNPPQLFGLYDIVLNFNSTAGFTQGSGVLRWEICGYDINIQEPQLTGLARCAGATSTSSNCDNVWKADITMPDRTTFSVVGPVMQVSGPNWTAAKQQIQVVTK